jgi:hypothetical protein
LLADRIMFLDAKASALCSSQQTIGNGTGNLGYQSHSERRQDLATYRVGKLVWLVSFRYNLKYFYCIELKILWSCTEYNTGSWTASYKPFSRAVIIHLAKKFPAVLNVSADHFSTFWSPALNGSISHSSLSTLFQTKSHQFLSSWRISPSLLVFSEMCY